MTWSSVSAAIGAESDTVLPIPVEDYAIYDRVIEAKFLTSQTNVVLVNRLTVSSLIPQGQPPTLDFFAAGDISGVIYPRNWSWIL